jgi:phospholipid/cholesterol/gamma-HCH transport system substrate-binding protein
MNDTFDRLNTISTRIEQGQGTLGKLSTDPSLFNNLTASSESLREFLAEFKTNPKKYITFRVRIFLFFLVEPPIYSGPCRKYSVP